MTVFRKPTYREAPLRTRAPSLPRRLRRKRSTCSASSAGWPGGGGSRTRTSPSGDSRCVRSLSSFAECSSWLGWSLAHLGAPAMRAVRRASPRIRRSFNGRPLEG